MKRLIQKTMSVFMSLAMVALIGSPAYATVAEDEAGSEVISKVIESVMTDTESDDSDAEIISDTEPVDETDIPPVCDNSDEETEIIPDESETEDEPETEIEQEAEEDDGDETLEEPIISEEGILDYIESEEFQDVIEDTGIDSEIIEGEIEDGNYEVIYITQEEFEQMRREHSLSIITQSVNFLGQSVLMFLMIPAAPVMFFVIPFVGPLAAGVMLMSPVVIIGALGLTVVSPIVAIIEYKNYELEPGYEIAD